MTTQWVYDYKMTAQLVLSNDKTMDNYMSMEWQHNWHYQMTTQGVYDYKMTAQLALSNDNTMGYDYKMTARLLVPKGPSTVGLQ